MKFPEISSVKAQGINDFNITIENLPAGIYVLKMNDGGKIESCSFKK